jgi:hypothetical protein
LAARSRVSAASDSSARAASASRSAGQVAEQIGPVQHPGHLVGRAGRGPDVRIGHGAVGVDEPQEAEQQVVVPDRQADPGEQAQLGRGRGTRRPARAVQAGGAAPGDHLGCGVPAEDRRPPYGVQRLVLRAVDQHLLMPVLDQRRPAHPVRDGVDDPLQLVLHPAPDPPVLRQMSDAGPPRIDTCICTTCHAAHTFRKCH